MGLSFFDELVCETAVEQAKFRAIPIILRAASNGVDRTAYLDFLAVAHDLIRQSNRLTQSALSRCDETDGLLRTWLQDQLAADSRHEEWLLDDLGAFGGDPDLARRAAPSQAVAALAAYAGSAIGTVGPYALLGLRHVLNYVSLVLSRTATLTMRSSLEADPAISGFSCFLRLGQRSYEDALKFPFHLDQMDTPEQRKVVIQAAKRFFPLLGDVFLGMSQSRKISEAETANYGTLATTFTLAGAAFART